MELVRTTILLGGASLTWLVGLIVYRLFLHPYAKYPGPFWAKITSWYSIYHTYYGDLHTDVYLCHEKYGEVVRYAPNRIVITSESGLKGIYGHGKNAQKSLSYLKMTAAPTSSIVGKVDKTEHGKLRRILNQGLSDMQIRAMSDELAEISTTFADRLGDAQDRFDTCADALAATNDRSLALGEDGWSPPKNLGKWCDFFTFDVMSQIIFGISYNQLTSTENHWVIDSIAGQMRRISFVLQLPELEQLGLQRVLCPDAAAKAKQFSQKCKAIMEERQRREVKKVEAMGNGDGAEAETGKMDLFSRLLGARDPETGEGLSQVQLWAESNSLIVAGSDTSSTAMAATFFYLCRDPAAYTRVTTEVRTAFPSPTQARQGPALSSCKYLNACIQEALRLSPSASGVMWREALPGGLVIPNTDIVIPAGLEVGTGIWALNHKEEHFPEPFAFRPERWIAAEVGEEATAKARAGFATFSHGPRNCVGKGLAMAEISLAMAAVISRYDFRSAKGALGKVGEGKGKFVGQYNTFWTFTSLKDGPIVQFKPIA